MARINLGVSKGRPCNYLRFLMYKKEVNYSVEGQTYKMGQIHKVAEDRLCSLGEKCSKIKAFQKYQGQPWVSCGVWAKVELRFIRVATEVV